uniref:Uncharacterized protein n=1 Tax=Anguilla anguilla TaxID=7936 RepID=A0A0E9Q327_ANGAN
MWKTWRSCLLIRRLLLK